MDGAPAARIRSARSRSAAIIFCSTSSPRSKRVAERIAIFKAAVEARGRVFDPMDVGVARAYFVAKDQADKDAALERRLEAQRRLAAISNSPDGSKNKSSIMAFSDTREASEESALYGTPDEIARQIGKAAQARRRLCVAQRRRAGGRQPAPLRARSDAGFRRGAEGAGGGIGAYSAHSRASGNPEVN